MGRWVQARRVKQLRAAAAAEGSAAAAMVASPVAVDKSPRRSPRLNSPRTAAAKAAASKADGACAIRREARCGRVPLTAPAPDRVGVGALVAQ